MKYSSRQTKYWTIFELNHIWIESHLNELNTMKNINIAYGCSLLFMYLFTYMLEIFEQFMITYTRSVVWMCDTRVTYDVEVHDRLEWQYTGCCFEVKNARARQIGILKWVGWIYIYIYNINSCEWNWMRVLVVLCEIINLHVSNMECNKLAQSMSEMEGTMSTMSVITW